MPFATWVNADRPNRAYGTGNDAGTPVMRVMEDERVGVLRLRPRVQPQVTVSEAPITLRLAAEWVVGSSTTLTLQRLGSRPPADVTWNTLPSGAGPTVTVAVAAGTYPVGTAFEFDGTVFAQRIADELAWYGLLLTSDNDTDMARFAGFAAVDTDLHPTWTAVTATPPEPPYGLSPDGGGGVASDVPLRTWVFADADGDEMSAYRIQTKIDDDDLDDTPDFDSGTVAATQPLWDPDGVVGYTPPVDGETEFYRIQHRDATGVWSEWSDVASWTPEPAAVITVTAPTGDVATPTPTVTATSTLDVSAYRVSVFDAAGVLLYTSGKIPGDTIVHTLPLYVQNKRTVIGFLATGEVPRSDWLQEDTIYTVQVDVWDTLARSAAVGVPVYATGTTTFTLDETAGNDIVQVTAIVPDPGCPWVDVTVELEDTPDGLVIFRNGVRVVNLEEDDLDDLETGTDTYTWRDWGAPAWRSNLYAVRATASGLQGLKVNAEATVASECEGVILVDPVSGAWVNFAGREVTDWAATLQRTSVQPVGGFAPTSMMYGETGLAGSFTGVIDEYRGRSVADQLADLEVLREKARRGQGLLLAAQNLNLSVTITSVLRPTPHPDSLPPNNLMHLVPIRFEERA